MSTSSAAQPSTVYIPGIGDHCHAIAAAMRAYGQPAEVLPPTSPATLATGMASGKGRECMFSLMVIGGMVHRAQQPDFDAERPALFFPSFTRKCVAVNYHSLFKDVLGDHGLAHVEILSPELTNNFRGMGTHPDIVRSLIWYGFIAIDLLMRIQHQRRPYELEPGATDAAYQRGLERIITAIESGDAQQVVRALARSGDDMALVPINRSNPRPRIGMLGDFYMLYNPYLYLDAIRQIEALGGEVEILRFAKFLYFVNLLRIQDAYKKGDRQRALQIELENAYQHHVEAELVASVRYLLNDENPTEPPAHVTAADIKRYYHLGIVNGGFTPGAAVDMARNGVSGLLHIVPFLCIGSIIGAGLAPRIRADLGQIPWLDITFDAQGGTNARTRLEAFLAQVAQFARSRASASPATYHAPQKASACIPLTSA